MLLVTDIHELPKLFKTKITNDNCQDHKTMLMEATFHLIMLMAAIWFYCEMTADLIFLYFIIFVLPFTCGMYLNRILREYIYVSLARFPLLRKHSHTPITLKLLAALFSLFVAISFGTHLFKSFDESEFIKSPRHHITEELIKPFTE